MGEETKIVVAVFLGTSIILILLVVIIFFVITYNKRLEEKNIAHKLAMRTKELELLKAVIDSQEQEREKIARNLHDEVGPLLTTLKLNISRYSRALKKDNLSVEMLDEERTFIDTIIDNVRTASHDLTPYFVVKYGISKALENYAAALKSPVITVESNVPDQDMEKNMVINLYRIILELVNNVLKHDLPSEMAIQLNQRENEIDCTIQHNGKGITNDDFDSFVASANGLGLSSIQSRVLLLNANLSFITNNEGAFIKLAIPITNTNERD